MKKIDLAVTVEIVGVTLVTTGLAMISVPIALIVCGSFLVWLTEKVQNEQNININKMPDWLKAPIDTNEV